MTRLTPKGRRDGHQQRFERLSPTIEPTVSHGWLCSDYPTQRSRHLLLDLPVWGKVSLEGFSSASALTSGHSTHSNGLAYMVWFYEYAFMVQVLRVKKTKWKHMMNLGSPKFPIIEQTCFMFAWTRASISSMLSVSTPKAPWDINTNMPGSWDEHFSQALDTFNHLSVEWQFQYFAGPRKIHV